MGRPPKREPERLPSGQKRPKDFQLPKKAHQWEVIDSMVPEIYHQCVICFKEKPGAFNNYNECPGYPDLFLHFKEDIQLIIKEYGK